MNDEITGKRFSQVYLLRGEPEKDSKRARFRLAKLAENSCKPAKSSSHGTMYDYNKHAQEKIESEIGIQFGTRSHAGVFVRSWEWYFSKVSVTDMLDTITVVAASLHRSYLKEDKRGKFLSEARRILREENLAYEIDEAGGVHPLVDATFSRAMESTILGLDDPRYTATAECVERIDSCLLRSPQDFTGGIRAVFGACENTFKLMYTVPRLDARAAGDRISRDQQRFYKDHPAMQAASAKMLESFKQWVDAAHFYRHEQGVEEPSQPAAELGILLISQGLSYVRWLAVLDAKAREQLQVS